MANEKPIQTRRELESHIVAQAWRDPKYKAKLLKNARGVVEEELKDLDPNVKLPDSLHVDVHEESPTQMHIVLPRDPREIAPGVNEESLATLAPQTVAVVVTNISNVQLVVVASVIAYPPATNVTVGPVQAVVAAVNVLTNATTTSVA